jgi:hypothetical protein
MTDNPRDRLAEAMQNAVTTLTADAQRWTTSGTLPFMALADVAMTVLADEAKKRWPDLDPTDDYDDGVRDVLRWLRGEA